METYFAPAKRTERRKFKNQIATVSHNPIISALLDAMTGILIVLNEDRQVVALNHGLLKAFGIVDAQSVLGLRVGEVLSCTHAEDPPNGCGTTPHCMTCGAAIAMMAAADGKTSEQICALTREDDNGMNDVCLQVRVKPITLENQRWLLFFARDITQEQFWINLEKVFFHDINNLLTTLLGNNQLLAMDMPDTKRIKENQTVLERLCSEIALQRSLSHKKNISYLTRKTRFTLSQLRQELNLFIKGHHSLTGKHIKETWDNETLVLQTDSLLLSKVLTNILINALEATPKGGEIQLTVRTDRHSISWDVWN
ncbi:MAG: hypothetical protein R6U68_01610, partial [Desulfobacteraceae bacterium]